MFYRFAFLASVALAEPTVTFDKTWCDNDCCKDITECTAPNSYEAFNNCGSKLPQGCTARVNTTISVPKEDVCSTTAEGVIGFKTGSIANYEWQPGYAFTLIGATSNPVDCAYELKIGKLADLTGCPDITQPAFTVTATGHTASSNIELTLTTDNSLPIIPLMADYWRFKTTTTDCALTAPATTTVVLGATLTASNPAAPDAASASVAMTAVVASAILASVVGF